MICEWAVALTMEGKSCFVVYFLSSSSLTLPFLSLPSTKLFLWYTELPKQTEGKGEGMRWAVSETLLCRFNTYILFRKYSVYVGQWSLQISIIYSHFYKYRSSHSRVHTVLCFLQTETFLSVLWSGGSKCQLKGEDRNERKQCTCKWWPCHKADCWAGKTL